MSNTTTKKEKLIKFLSKKPHTSDQLVQRCGYVARSSVTSAIAALRRSGVNVMEVGTTRDGLVKYAI